MAELEIPLTSRPQVGCFCRGGGWIWDLDFQRIPHGPVGSTRWDFLSHPGSRAAAAHLRFRELRMPPDSGSQLWTTLELRAGSGCQLSLAGG